MNEPRPEVIVASTLYLMTSWVFDPTPCPCRLKAIVAHLERMMAMPGLDPVLRATAIQLHAHWRAMDVSRDAPVATADDGVETPILH